MKTLLRIIRALSYQSSRFSVCGGREDFLRYIQYDFQIGFQLGNLGFS